MAPLALERARHEHARLVLEHVLEECDRAGVDVLPVKGILTARLLYPDPGQRPIQDIDLRVRERDLARVEQLGTRAGWRLVSRSMAYRMLSFEVLGFLVEFESHVGPPGLCGLQVDAMILRAERRTGPFSAPHLHPELHDHALLLCVNAFKDKLIEALPGAVRDLELLADLPEFSSDRFVSLARESGASSIVWLVANWLEEARHSQAWGKIRDRLGRVAPRPLYAYLFERAIRARPPPRAVLRVLARAGADHPGAQVRALSTMALKPLDRVWFACLGASNSLRARRNQAQYGRR